MTRGFGKPPTRRQRKVNSNLQKKISEMLSDGNFFGLTGMITVSFVETTPDLREAKVWVSVFNQDPQEALKILNQEIYNIQGQLFKAFGMRLVPKVRFVIDHSGEYSDHINQVLKNLDDGKK